MTHKRIDFTKNGGLPFSQYILERMQDSYADISALIVQLAGAGNMILSGVTLSQGAWSNGWLVYNNELLPFAASSGTFLEVVTDAAYLTFGDGENKPVVVSKYAKAKTDGDFLNDIPMQHLPAQLYMGVAQTGPFPRARSFKELRDDIGTFWHNINKELKPIYSAVKTGIAGVYSYVFDVPLNIDFSSTYPKARADIISGGNINWAHNTISTILMDEDTHKIHVSLNSSGAPTFDELKIYVEIYNREY
jgi:hypothetical protein